jgi:sister-chromatid-cohesion protein PDS5
VIVGFLVKHILMQPGPSDEVRIVIHGVAVSFFSRLQDAMKTDEGDEWAPDSEVSWLTKAKLMSLKICRNRCIAHGTSKSAPDVGTPVLKMLFTLLTNAGSMTENTDDECGFFLHFDATTLTAC